MAVNGVAVAGLSIGALFVYGGITGKSPLTVFHAVLTGNSPKSALQSQGINVGGASGGITSGTGSASTIISAAESQSGKPYVWDAPLNPNDPNPSGFDCSGLTQWSYAKAGIKISHNTVSQYHTDGLTRVPATDMQPGDLVFYGAEAAPHHVAIYLGGGQVIDAFDFGTTVQARSVSQTPGMCKFVCRPKVVPQGSTNGGAGGTPDTNKSLALMLMSSYGWNSPAEFSALDSLWTQESGWSQTADTRKTGSGGDNANSKVFAYGISQARPATKLPLAGRPPDLGGHSDAKTQIIWGLQYIRSRYGSPTKAEAHEQANGWY